jgi:hypothetical protein
MIYAVAFVHARIRAETGTAVMSVFPWKQHEVFVTALGGHALMSGSRRSLTALTMLGWLGRGHFPELMSYQLDDLELCRRARLAPRQMAGALIFALAVGLLAAYWTHLRSYYEFGANVLEGGTTAGGYRVRVQTAIYERSARMMLNPAGPDVTLCKAVGFGGLVVAALHGLRAALLRFPLSPLGYAMSAAYGYLLWGPFLLASVSKLVTLKLGGARMYRRVEPVFIGLALGQFFTAGVLWGLLVYMGTDMWQYYHVTFD